MMHTFLANNRAELIARCSAKVLTRPHRNATPEQLENGIPIFLDQLQRTLEAEGAGAPAAGLRISGNADGGDLATTYEMGVSATAHGKQLLKLGYSVDQVVHDYGDLCQAITGLADERDAPFAVDEFRTLNRCLDNAIADAVTEFSLQRDVLVASNKDAEIREVLGYLVHELRNALGTAMLAVNAMESGSLPMTGATGSVLKRAHAALKTLVDRALHDVKVDRRPPDAQSFDLATVIADAASAAALHAKTSGCTLVVESVDPLITVSANRERLLGAIANLLQNAFKFTQPKTVVTLRAFSDEDRVFIEVADHCGGLPAGSSETMFSARSQRSADRSGLGVGLSISRHIIESDGGTLTVTDVPGHGCIFTITLSAPCPVP